MKYRILLFTALTLTATVQSPADAQQTAKRQSFDEFRKGLIDDYNNFRNSILEHYDQFLEGAWVDYQQFKGEEAYTVPKPKVAPNVADATPVTPRPNRVLNPTVSPRAEEPQPRPRQTIEPPTPTPEPRPTKPADESRQRQPYSFDFYEIELQMPETDIKLASSLTGNQAYAAQWRSLAKDPEVKVLIDAVEAKASELNLNDYLKFELAAHYIDSRYAGRANASSRMSLKHFILANMGYAARLGINARDEALLLIPCRQAVYGRLFIKVDNKKYYVFGVDNYDAAVQGNTSISSCKLPSGEDLGKDMDLTLNGLNLPYKPHKYDLSFGDLNIKGEVNGSVFPMLYRYPQMPTADFARSYIFQDVRDDIVGQFKSQLSGREERKAVDDLLQFVQGAFEYATDSDNHGFEKPYFFEEILYYDKCDCEDRAIFYTYLLWNVLGLENHLINYPGHESASVSLSAPISGDSYSHGGRMFYISDPTFIGARTGMCMPSYTNTAPNIDLEYK